MANYFNQDFQDFIEALNKAGVEYLLVGGYAVILHGYIRSTADMDIWVNKTKENFIKIKSAFLYFGAPIFSEAEFLDSDLDVWSIGIEPNRIVILNQVKGIDFSTAYSHCASFEQNGVQIKYISLKDLILAKEAAGRFKDKDDLEQLKNKKASP